MYLIFWGRYRVTTPMYRACLHFAFAVARTAQVTGKDARTRVFFQNSVSLLGFYVSEPIGASLLSGYDEISTESIFISQYNNTLWRKLGIFVVFLNLFVKPITQPKLKETIIFAKQGSQSHLYWVSIALLLRHELWER